MDTITASQQIDAMSRESNLRQAYYDGHQDGALSTLAPALGVEPGDGQPTHTLMGRRFRVSIEWIDPVDERDLSVARQMAERAQQRAAERL